MIMHTTIKNWICDYCGSRFGARNVLTRHVMSHIPLSFACSKCPRKFTQSDSLKRHLKTHAGILNEICEICKKGFSTKETLSMHIILQHFTKLDCEIPNCAYKSGLKVNYKRHLRTKHRDLDQNLMEKIIEKIDKLKIDFPNLKYV